MKRVVLVGINAKYTHTNLAIRSLAKYAGRPQVQLVEYSINQPLEQVAQDLAEQKAHIYGFSTYIWNISYIRALAEKMPGKVLLGGPEASSSPEECLLFSDYVIRGEGEEAFRIFMDKLEAGEDVLETPSLCYRSQSGAFVENPPAPAVDLAKLPQPYEQPEHLGGKIIYYESSRGCPFACAYCLSSLSGGVRFAPVEKVKKDLDVFIAAGVGKVKFVDRTFNADRRRAQEIFRYVMERAIRISIHFEIEADLLDEATCKLLSKARPGQIQLEIGVQSTHLPTLQAVCRAQDFSYTAKMVRALAAGKNLHLHLDLIAGLPLEGMKEFCRSIDDVMQLGAEKVQLGFLKVLKGSKMRELAGKYGICFSKNPPYEVRSTAHLSAAELQVLHQVEYLLERTYNAGLFRQVVQYFGGRIGYARFYLELREQFEREGAALLGLTELQLAQALLRFCRERQDAVAEQVLLLDLLLKKRRPRLPAELEQKREWKRAFYRSFPDGQLQSLPRAKRPWHFSRLEEFSFDVCAYLRSGALQGQPGRYLFDYTVNRVRNLQTGEQMSFWSAFPLPPAG